MRMRFFIASILFAIVGVYGEKEVCSKSPQNNCITFSVSQGTGCAWMCEYCADQLGTNNYYFKDSVCSYQQGTGCVGNPLSGVSYTCCSV